MPVCGISGRWPADRLLLRVWYIVKGVRIGGGLVLEKIAGDYPEGKLGLIPHGVQVSSERDVGTRGSWWGRRSGISRLHAGHPNIQLTNVILVVIMYIGSNEASDANAILVTLSLHPTKNE